VLACLLASCVGSGPALPPPAPHANGQVLWEIVHGQCVPGQLSRGDPAPCAVVSMPDGAARGYAILKDRNGVAQYLLMPTAKIAGIEDPAILQPGATNYFAKAWDDRGLIEKRLGRPLPRTRISIAVNSAYGRTQDQLHLHMDCVDLSVGAALQAAAIPRTGRWASHVVPLHGHPYRVRWLKADALEAANPFTLLAGEMPGARRAMGAWTIALIGATGDDGAPGFYILADRVDLAAHDDASSEELQDHACKPERGEAAAPDSQGRGP
jgi:CDP-diacylglycerol pyrophosphatase